MMSYDFRAIERVTQFASFLDALVNPQAIKATIDDLDAKARELKTLLGAQASKEAAEAYRDELMVGVEAEKANLAREKAAFEASREKAMEAVKRVEQRAAEHLENAQKLSEEAEAERSAATARKKELDKLDKDLQALQVKLQSRQEAVTQAEQVLAEKQAQLKQLFGG